MGIIHDLRRLRFWRRFFTHAFAGVGALAVAAGIVDVFFVDALDGQTRLIWLGGFLALTYGLVRAWPRPIEVSIDSPATSIRIVRGDIFDQESHLAIGVCDTFDTAAPFIASNSVQWEFQTRVYGSDLVHLDGELDKALENTQPIGTIAKEGKTVHYEIGTVVTLRSLARRFFLVAYSSMDSTNKAHATADGLWKSLANLWSAARIASNGHAIAIPVIGGGQSGLSPVLPAEDAIRFIALSFIIASRQDRVCEELRIVALPAQYDRLNHFELQTFLSSLKRT